MFEWQNNFFQVLTSIVVLFVPFGTSNNCAKLFWN